MSSAPLWKSKLTHYRKGRCVAISQLLTEVSAGNLQIADNPSESRRVRATPEGE